MPALQTHGFKDLNTSLGLLRQAAGKAALNRGLAKAAAPLVSKMQAAAPVKEGDLRRNIIASKKSRKGMGDAGKAAFAAALRAGASRSQASSALRDAYRENGGKPAALLFVGVAGGPASVAHLFEFGSSHQPAMPYMRPTWDADQGPMLDRLRALLKVEIDKSIARATKRGTLRT